MASIAFTSGSCRGLVFGQKPSPSKLIRNRSCSHTDHGHICGSAHSNGSLSTESRRLALPILRLKMHVDATLFGTFPETNSLVQSRCSAGLRHPSHMRRFGMKVCTAAFWDETAAWVGVVPWRNGPFRRFLNPSEALCYASNGRSGVWRSLVAHLHGVQGVTGSNPVTPTSSTPHLGCPNVSGHRDLWQSGSGQGQH